MHGENPLLGVSGFPIAMFCGVDTHMAHMLFYRPPYTCRTTPESMHKQAVTKEIFSLIIPFIYFHPSAHNKERDTKAA